MRRVMPGSSTERTLCCAYERKAGLSTTGFGERRGTKRNVRKAQCGLCHLEAVHLLVNSCVRGNRVWHSQSVAHDVQLPYQPYSGAARFRHIEHDISSPMQREVATRKGRSVVCQGP